VSHDIYKIQDENNLLIHSPILSGSDGLIIRQEMNKNISIETGLFFKLYYKGFGISGFPESRFSNSATQSFQIPFRLNSKVILGNGKFSIGPRIGYVFCINNSFNNGAASGSTRFMDGLTLYGYHEISNYSLTKTFSLLETSIGLEFIVFKQAILTVSPTYFMGFTKLIELDINYQRFGSPPHIASAHNKGQNLSLGIGLRFPISGIWTK